MANIEKILLAGQDLKNHHSIRAALEFHSEWQYAVIQSVRSIREALEELSISSYRMLLIDCESLEPSPLEILIQLRAVTKHTPVILINRPGMEKTAVSCLRNGANYYLIKDKGWEEELPHVMDSVLAEHRQRHQLKSKLNFLEGENKRLKDLSILDEETQFYSSDHFNSLLSRELKKAARYRFDLTCLVMNIENSSDPLEEMDVRFLYSKFGMKLKAIVRACDIWARLGDNQFAALMPYTSTRQARDAIRRITSELEMLKSTGDKKASTTVKFRWGLAKYDQAKIKNEIDLINLAVSTVR